MEHNTTFPMNHDKTFPVHAAASGLDGRAIELFPKARTAGNFPFLPDEDTAGQTFTQTVQRLLDVTLTAALLLLLLPVFLVIAILIRLDSPGPILFTQTRVGKDGAEFPFFKFRSMVADAVSRIVQMAQKTGRPRYVCTGNLDHLVTIHHDPEFREIYAGADLVLADGAPVVWLSRLSPEGPLRERVTGSDLFWELARASAATGIRLFFLGGQPCAADRAAEAVQKRYPNVHVCGTYCPSFTEFDTPAEQERIRAEIRETQPDILLVGLGAPKQEKWIHANKGQLGIPVCIGVGGTFEMAGGVVKRAPQWMQQAGMEWAYRFLQEPTRLWKRYFAKDLPFLLSLTVQAALTGRKRQTDTTTRGAMQEAPERLREVA